MDEAEPRKIQRKDKQKHIVALKSQEFLLICFRGCFFLQYIFIFFLFFFPFISIITFSYAYSNFKHMWNNSIGIREWGTFCKLAWWMWLASSSIDSQHPYRTMKMNFPLRKFFSSIADRERVVRKTLCPVMRRTFV